ncbi:hypothetical protein [Salibacter sp.]|uniref:hypothetical protein n=1 Tax=Salibacter sp. TaxID=2010995 RepID=UPI00286FE2FA|nr:hypothetical protein [Salibacter sp.]MDR9487026.1 hypothetical protein [Salibacter sp.]
MRRFFIFLLVVIPSLTIAQRNFTNIDFRDGIYLKYEDFQLNDPLLPQEVYTPLDKNDPEFFTKLFELTSFRYENENGELVNVFTDEVFGLCANGNPYVQAGGGFYKIMVLGKLSYFLINDVQSGFKPQVGLAAGSFGTAAGVSIPVGGYSNEMRSFIFEFQSGEIKEMTPQNVAEFIKDDEQLYQQFMNLKRRERNVAMYIYVRKYNEKYPVSFPDKKEG